LKGPSENDGQTNKFTYDISEEDFYGETVESSVTCHLYEGMTSNIIGGLTQDFRNEIGQ
jgi:hypothetical protein